MVPQESPGSYGCDEVRKRRRVPYAVQSPELRKHEQSRNQEQALPAQAKEHRFPGNTDALEKLADGYLRTDNDEHHQTDPQAVGRHLDQLRIAGERTGYQPRKQDARQTAQPHDNCRSDDDQPQGVLHALMLSGTVIEPDDRLHPLRDTDNKHHQQHADTGNDAVGSQRQGRPRAPSRHSSG